MSANRVHYFVVAGYIDDSGQVRLGDDPEVADAVLDGTVYDETANEWSVCQTDNDVSNDERILSALRRRLATTEVTA